MATAKHQAAWRANAKRTRIEVYLDQDELAKLDAIGGENRASAVRRLITGAVIPADALDQLRRDFSDQDAAYGVDWAEVTKAATIIAERRKKDCERQREIRTENKQQRAAAGIQPKRREPIPGGRTSAEKQLHSRGKHAIEHGIPEVVQALQAGTITPCAAARIADMPKEQQAEALESAIARQQRKVKRTGPGAKR